MVVRKEWGSIPKGLRFGINTQLQWVNCNQCISCILISLFSSRINPGWFKEILCRLKNIIHDFDICQTNLLRSRTIPSYIYNITNYTLPPINGFVRVRLWSTTAEMPNPLGHNFWQSCFSLCFKPFISKWESLPCSYRLPNQTQFHLKGCAPELVL